MSRGLMRADLREAKGCVVARVALVEEDGDRFRAIEFQPMMPGFVTWPDLKAFGQQLVTMADLAAARKLGEP